MLNLCHIWLEFCRPASPWQLCHRKTRQDPRAFSRPGVFSWVVVMGSLAQRMKTIHPLRFDIIAKSFGGGVSGQAGHNLSVWWKLQVLGH